MNTRIRTSLMLLFFLMILTIGASSAQTVRIDQKKTLARYPCLSTQSQPTGFHQLLDQFPPVMEERVKPRSKFCPHLTPSAEKPIFHIGKKQLNGWVIVETLSQEWIDSLWQHTSKDTFIYDGNEKLIEKLSTQWVTDAWKPLSREMYSYDSSGRTTGALYQDWNDTTWVNSWQSSTTFDSAGREREWVRQEWTNGVWEYASKWSYTYDSLGHITEELSMTWYLDAWENVQRYLLILDGAGHVTEVLALEWSGDDWEKYVDMLYILDSNGNPIDQTTQMWTGDSWVNLAHSIYTFDANNRLTELIYQRWVSVDWDNDQRYVYSYDGDGNMIEELTEDWNGSKWENDFKYSNTWRPITSIRQDIIRIERYSLSANFPNPFNPSTTIVFTLPTESFVTLTIFDVLGREVTTLLNERKQAGNHAVQWNGASVPSGVYFYRIQAGKFVDTKKMVLLH